MVRLQKCWPHCCASIKGKRTQPVAWGRRGSISSNWRLATLQRKPCVQRHMRAPGWLSAIDPLTVHEVRREDVASSPRSSANRPAVANLPAFRQHSRARSPRTNHTWGASYVPYLRSRRSGRRRQHHPRRIRRDDLLHIPILTTGWPHAFLATKVIACRLACRVCA